MADNLHTFVKLPDSGVLRLVGPDAEIFAQSQFANDVMALEPGHWQWNCWLSAKGRVRAIFALARPAAGELVMLLPDGGAQDIGFELQRFVFRRKVQLALDTAPVSGALQAPSQAHGPQLALLDGGVLELDVGTAALPRTLRVGMAADASPEQVTIWRQSDLRLGLPRLSSDQVDVWTAQQLGLDRLNAYSVRKGCYPGQEIVARTHFLGKAKRATALLAVQGSARPGTDVTAGDTVIGKIASAADGLALAVLPLDAELSHLAIDGQPAAPASIVEGLAR